MKISRSTKERITAIKADSNAVKAQLSTLLARLEEHAGTKRVSKKLEQVISKLEEWQRLA